MKDKIGKALLDAGFNIIGDSHNELHLENNIAVRVYDWEKEGVVAWHIDDFKSTAKEYIAREYPDATPEEKKVLYSEMFDESKYPEALERMIDEYDASVGISWDEVDYYLHEYCLKW